MDGLCYLPKTWPKNLARKTKLVLISRSLSFSFDTSSVKTDKTITYNGPFFAFQLPTPILYIKQNSPVRKMKSLFILGPNRLVTWRGNTRLTCSDIEAAKKLPVTFDLCTLCPSSTPPLLLADLGRPSRNLYCHPASFEAR